MKKQEAKELLDKFDKIFGALPKKKMLDFVAEGNDLYLYFQKLVRESPE